MIGTIRDRVRRAVEWCGFTPTLREAHLQRLLDAALEQWWEHQVIVVRIVRLVRYRESLGATTIDIDSIRGALSGQDTGTR